MQRLGIVVFALLLWSPALGWADNRNGASGSDGAYYQADAQPGTNVTVLRNGIALSANPAPNVLVQSNPALTRLGSTLYVVVRSTDNNKIYCTKSASPYTSWSPWVYVNGQTLDAPSIVSNSGGTQVRAYVRSTNNLLYSADLTNCPSAPTWTAPGPTMQYAPSAVSDPSGIYVWYESADYEFHRWQQGTTSFPVVRGFGVDQDVTAAGLYAHVNTEDQGSPAVAVGYNPIFHRAVSVQPSNPLNLTAAACPSGSSTALVMGGPLTYMCYAKDSSTGDFIIQSQMLTGGTAGLLHKFDWRSCMNGNSIGMFTDNCDFYTQLNWFRNIASASSINLRAWVSASGTPASFSGYVELAFRLKYVLDPWNNNSAEIEFLFIPYWYAQSGCKEFDGGYDIHGRYLWGFTPACLGGGAQNLGDGQSQFYNLNLRSYILMRFGDYFRGYNTNIDPVIDHWAVTWGLTTVTIKDGTNKQTSAVQHTALDVLF